MFASRKHNNVVACVLLLVSLSVACAPTTIPPELKPSYTANEVLMRVQELQNTVIGLYDAKPRGITKDSADVIVRFTVSAATIIQGSLAGWQQTVKAAWSALKLQYAPTDTSLQVIWNLTDVMINSLVNP